MRGFNTSALLLPKQAPSSPALLHGFRFPRGKPLVVLSDDTLCPISPKLFSLVGNITSGTPRWNLFAAGSLMNLTLIAALTALLRRLLSTRAVAQYEG
jgi:hypothetical protein